jgi:hypothetical protein
MTVKWKISLFFAILYCMSTAQVLFFIVILSPAVCFILLYGYEEITDFFYSIWLKIVELWRDYSGRYSNFTVKKFYAKYNVTIEFSLLYGYILKACFPKRPLWLSIKKFEYEVWRTLYSERSVDFNLIKKTVQLKYEIHAILTNFLTDSSFRRITSPVFTSVQIASKDVPPVPVKSLIMLGHKNITSWRYVELSIRGYSIDEIVKWADVPYEWFDALGLKAEKPTAS